MKKLLLIAATAFMTFGASAQYGTAPDFSVTDLDGNQINLYADILDQGLIAVVDVSATWCGPCWNLHQSHALEDLHQAYGPNGTNQLRVIFYEGDASPTQADLEGTGPSTIGNWLEGVTYPIINEAPLTLDLSIWAPLGFPTVNVIRPSDYEIVLDTYAIYSVDGQVDAINNADLGITLDPALSVVENQTAASVNVYPNPSRDHVNLQLDGFDGTVQIEVYDMLGNIAFQMNTSNKMELINLAELSAGNYMIRVYNDAAESTSRIVLMD